MALITPAQARELLPYLEGTGEDSLLETLIARAGVAMARWCGVPSAAAGDAPTLEVVEYTLYLDGPGGVELRLPIYPVTEIGSLYNDPGRLYAAHTLVEDYTLLGEEGLILLSPTGTTGAWCRARRGIKATFSAGWATIPGDMAQACAMTVKAWYEGRHVQGRASTSAGAASATLREEGVIPTGAQALLAEYRLPGVWLGGAR